MIVYSCAPHREFVAFPGERVVYGASEHAPQGFGTVKVNSKGELVVNHKPIQHIMRKYAYVRKV